MKHAPLSAAGLRSGLALRVVGREITCFDECDSTNARALAAARAGAPDGTVFVAEAQTAGRGQRGRSWLAPPGECILMSIILRPILPAGHAHLLTMLAACAAASAVEATVGLRCPLKWPNDLTLGERKLGGILVETSFLGDSLEHAVVGVGLNVNLDVDRFPEIAGTATSLARELGAPVDRAPLARELLRQLDLRYVLLGEGRAHEIHAEWRQRLDTLGRRAVVIDAAGQSEEVVAEDVTPDGGLVVRRADGTRRTLHFGEVSLRGAG